MRPEYRRRLPDLLLWAVLAAPVVAGQVSLESGWYWKLAAGLLVLTGALWAGLRSSHPYAPLAGLAAVIVGSVVEGNLSFSVPVLAYLVGRRVEAAWPTAVVFVVTAVGGSALTVGVLGTRPATWFFLAATLVFAGVFPWLVGRFRRQQNELVTMGWQRAEQLERERGMVSAQARLRERARIARDMHDSLGHDLSLLALRAGALELAAGPESRAAAEVRAGVLEATERLREIIGVLRDDGDEAAPLGPPDETVEALVARARASGLEVTLSDGTDGPARAGPAGGTDGPAPNGLVGAAAGPRGGAARAGPADAGDGPGAIGRTVYRVVQEALTNAARHAPGAPVTVEVATSAGATAVTVANPVPARSVAVEGFGLAGLRERVRMAGGTFTAGVEGRAFRVHAHLPHVTPPRRPPAAPLHTARRKVRRSLVVAVAAPASIAAVMSLTYYPFASFDSVLESDTFEALEVGRPRAELPLPGRQVLQPPSERHPPGTTCEYYSDGNFPMASATYRLCFREGRLTSKDKLN